MENERSKIADDRLLNIYYSSGFPFVGAHKPTVGHIDLEVVKKECTACFIFRGYE